MRIKKIKKQRFYLQQYDKLIHALKASIAVFIGYVISLLLPYPRSYWIILTIVVIMTAERIVGLQINKSILRIAGTIVGAILGVATIVVGHDLWLTGLLLILVTFCFVAAASYFEDLSYAGVMGIVTFVMITLTPQPTLESAFYRIVDVLIGIAICLLVSRFVFPLNSSGAFKRESRITFLKLAQLADLLYIKAKPRHRDVQTLKLEAKISNRLNRHQVIISAIKFEKVGRDPTRSVLLLMMRYQRAIYRYLLFMHLPYLELSKTNKQLFNQQKKMLTLFMSSFNEALAKFNSSQPVTVNIAQLQRYLKDYEPTENTERLIYYSLGRLIFCIKRLSIYWNKI